MNLNALEIDHGLIHKKLYSATKIMLQTRIAKTRQPGRHQRAARRTPTVVGALLLALVSLTNANAQTPDQEPPDKTKIRIRISRSPALAAFDLSKILLARRLMPDAEYLAYLDGRNLGQIKWERPKDLEVAPGEHTLEIKIKTKPIWPPDAGTVSTAKNGKLKFRIKNGQSREFTYRLDTDSAKWSETKQSYSQDPAPTEPPAKWDIVEIITNSNEPPSLLALVPIDINNCIGGHTTYRQSVSRTITKEISLEAGAAVDAAIYSFLSLSLEAHLGIRGSQEIAQSSEIEIEAPTGTYFIYHYAWYKTSTTGTVIAESEGRRIEVPFRVPHSLALKRHHVEDVGCDSSS